MAEKAKQSTFVTDPLTESTPNTADTGIVEKVETGTLSTESPKKRARKPKIKDEVQKPTSKRTVRKKATLGATRQKRAGREKFVKVTFSCPQSLHRELRKQAKGAGISKAAQIVKRLSRKSLLERIIGVH